MIPSASASQSPCGPRSSAMLWCGMRQAECLLNLGWGTQVFAQLGLVVIGNLATIRVDLSLSCTEGKSAAVHSSQAECSLLQPFCLSQQSVLQPAKAPCLLYTVIQDWDTQSAAWPTYPQCEYTPVHPPFSSESLPRDTDPNQITFLPFQLNYVCIFLTALLVHESFCQLPVGIVPHVDVFLTCLRQGGDLHVLLLCHLYFCLSRFIFCIWITICSNTIFWKAYPFGIEFLNL